MRFEVSLKKFKFTMKSKEQEQSYLLRERFPTYGARESIFFVVRSQMCHHVSFLRESLSTNGTSMRFFLRVNRSHVCSQIASLSESFPT